MDKLGKAEAGKFQDKMVAHLKEFFPEACEELGEPQVRESISHGVERAESYGLVDEQDVCTYIDVMYVFGPDFDRAPECSWASRILKDESIDDPGDRAEMLHEEALAQVAALEGRTHEEG
jgi:hypothetical protein